MQEAVYTCRVALWHVQKYTYRGREESSAVEADRERQTMLQGFLLFSCYKNLSRDRSPLRVHLTSCHICQVLYRVFLLVALNHPANIFVSAIQSLHND